MSSSLFQIGYSGLHAAQLALSTVGQNVANVSTPGYSRLVPQLRSLAAEGLRDAGGGVQVTRIERLASDFQNQQLWRATTELGFHEATQQYLTALEGLLAGDGASISVGLDNFFSALSAATTAPDSVVLRQQILNEAGQLAQRFNGLAGNIQAQLEALHGQRRAAVGELGGVAANIAELNRRIVELESAGRDTATLRDHRDELIRQLSGYASVRVEAGPDGALNVSLADGQPLVVGKTAASLTLSTDASGQQHLELVYAGTGFPLQPNRLGGLLGALHEAEYGSLRPVLEDLHVIAGELADMVNARLAGGYDLAGNPGGPLFVYDENSITRMLELAPLAPEELAFSSQPSPPGGPVEVGNNDVLLELLGLRTATITIDGSEFTLNDAYAGVVGRVASASRQNQADLDSARTVEREAQAQRDAVSAVNLDEEAVNLMAYTQAYQANMKVIGTADRLFAELLTLF